ncbi:photosystem II 5 kDa protein, chloroplastic-like [Typha latifolia]|uniref:photosystem II 5 kDa protein, chloroplastic-like n=1 Tax=Typha latifolia TaxID=4733 RepID=UPI003C2F0A8B
MASLTTMASFLGGSRIADRPSTNHRRSIVVAKAAAKVQFQDAAKPNAESREDSGRRAVMFAAAAAAISLVGEGVATAGEEPKRGTAEAKKLYAPVCVTMPTAKICRN